MPRHVRKLSGGITPKRFRFGRVLARLRSSNLPQGPDQALTRASPVAGVVATLDGTTAGIAVSVAMARFYIHLENGEGFLEDEVGRECADQEAARREAVCAGADIIADELKHGCSSVHVTLFIEDDHHVRVMQV